MHPRPSLLVALFLASILVAACGLGDVGPEERAAAEALTTCGALLAPTSATASAAQSGNPASHAVDGNTATRWSNEGAGSTLTVDLGGLKRLCAINVAWYEGNSRVNTFTLATSADGQTFTQVYSGKSSGKSTALESYAVNAPSARYVRLVFSSNTVNDWASVAELSASGAGAVFVHPGVLVTEPALAFVKGRIAAKAAPWYGAYTAAAASPYASTAYTPHPVSTMSCGSEDTSDVGCSAAGEDAVAAYTQALLWSYTGNAAYAAHALAILRAWTQKLKDVAPYSGAKAATTSNDPLVAAWLGELFPRAAELLRYSYSGWTTTDTAQTTAMLNLFVPLIHNGWPSSNLNWSLSMSSAMIQIGVFEDDVELFNSGVALWKSVLPATIYLSTDGSHPRAPPGGDFSTTAELEKYWNPVNTTRATFTHGQEQETCRDFVHLTLALASLVNGAETARIQGQDLYAYEDTSTRLRAAFELHASMLNAHAANGSTTEYASICGSGMKPPEDTPTWEIGYNALVNRKGMSLPNTASMLRRIRPTGVMPSAVQQVAWETLTHAGTGDL